MESFFKKGLRKWERTKLEDQLVTLNKETFCRDIKCHLIKEFRMLSSSIDASLKVSTKCKWSRTKWLCIKKCNPHCLDNSTDLTHWITLGCCVLHNFVLVISSVCLFEAEAADSSEWTWLQSSRYQTTSTWQRAAGGVQTAPEAQRKREKAVIQERSLTFLCLSLKGKAGHGISCKKSCQCFWSWSDEMKTISNLSLCSDAFLNLL